MQLVHTTGSDFIMGWHGFGDTSMPDGVNLHCLCDTGTTIVFPSLVSVAGLALTVSNIKALLKAWLNEQESLPVHVCPKCGIDGSSDKDKVLAWLQALR
ncbi:MAG: hypothetical protein ABIH67_04760 [Candidatus Uhrbacteria bacterium]